MFCIPPIVHAQTRILPDIYNPEMITVSGSDLIVVEDATISVFTLPDLQLRTSFGRKGEGPGEMQVTLFWTNSVTVLADAYLVDGMNKVMYFDRDGKFLQELPRPSLIHQQLGVRYYTLSRGKLYAFAFADEETPLLSSARRWEIIFLPWITTNFWVDVSFSNGRGPALPGPP